MPLLLMKVPFTNIAPGLDVSRLCLGTMTFGEQNSYTDAMNQLNMASEFGINFIDTAEMYPVPQHAKTQGKSEQYVGRWLKETRAPRDKVVLATKVTGPSGQMNWIRSGPLAIDAKNIMNALDGSLKRLQTDYIDLYQLHWPDRYVPMFGEINYDPSRQYSSVPFEEQLEALSSAVASGKNAYNLLCRTFDAGLAECCHKRGVALLGYSPLAMGLLSGKYLAMDGGPRDARLNLYKGRYTEAECRYHLEKPNVIPAIKAYGEIARRHNMTNVMLAIGFVLRHPLIKSVIIGATKTSQLQEVFDACQVDMAPHIISEIDQVHERYPNPCP